MPGNKQVTLKKPKSTGKLNPSEMGKLLKAYRLVLLMVFLFTIGSVGFYEYLFRAAVIPQARLSTLITAGSLVVFPLAYLLVKRGLVLFPGVLTLLAVSWIYSGSEIVWQGLSLYHVTGGLLWLFITGALVLPHNRPIRWMMTLLFLLLIFLLNNNLPLTRYPAGSIQLLSIYSIVVNGILLLVVFVMLLQLIQLRSIRTRLTFAFVMLVLIPVVGTTTLSTYLGRRGSQEQVTNQLRSVATLKEAEIRSWLESLEPNLYLALTQPGQQEHQPMMENLISGYPSIQDSSLVIYNQVKSRFEQTIEQGQEYQEIFLMNLDGTVLLSTQPENEGLNFRGRNFLEDGKKGFFITPPTRAPETGKIGIIASIPFYNQEGQLIAVIGGLVNMERMSRIMSERAGLGDTGETYIVSPQHYLLTASRFDGWDIQSAPLHSEGITNAVDIKQDGSGSYTSYRGVPVLGVYRWMPDLNIGLIAEQDLSEAFMASNRLFMANAGIAIIAILVAVAASIFVTHRITDPLQNLGETVKQFASGNLSLYAKVEQEDEIGTLARSFNSMTDQIRSLIGELEQRVAERTQALERRSIQLKVAAEVARDATGSRDLDELLNRAVNLIRDRYGFYHAGIFLNDAQGEYAILRAATGEAGRQMIEAGHKLKVGATGIVGYVSGYAQSRVAHDVGIDATHFKNPLLPSTRSEAALPLKVGERVIGALDVQSEQPAAFTSETVEVLQIMTDQLAVAIENARLLKQMESSVKELEAAYGKYTLESWRDFFKRSSRLHGFRNRGLGAEPVSSITPEAAEAWVKERTVLTPPLTADGDNGQPAQTNLAIPVKLRGQTVGVVNLQVKGKVVPAETIALFEDIVNRLSLSLENVRLLEETQLRSEQINLLQETTAIAASHVNLNELLKAVGKQLRKGFELSNCLVILFNPEGETAAVVADERLDPNIRNSIGERFWLAGNQAMQEVIHSQKSGVYYDVQHNPCLAEMQFFLEERDTQAVMMVPLISRGEVTGIITMETDDADRRFVEDDLRLADQIGLQVSTAADVARLFEQTEHRAERERTISEITSKVRASTNLDAILKTAVQELAEALQLPTGAIQLSGDDGGFSNEQA